MDAVILRPPKEIGYHFIPQEYLPRGKDEYYLRNQQNPRPAEAWRHLTAREIVQLGANGNTCENWDRVLVSDPFEPARVINNQFFGLVRIGALDNSSLEFHDLQMPVGITQSRVISCDIGDHCAIHNVRYLSHYIIGNQCMLLSIDEMHCTNHAKFGNGILKEGEPESVRVRLELMNETGGRSILPFDGMLPADAALWTRYREDADLLARLEHLTQASFDGRRGWYGTIGDSVVMKSCHIIKDVKIGDCCYIKGANKLKNLTINSNADEPTQIGEGVELVNGIIGSGCHIFYGCKAVRFILGSNSNLKYGARLIHSFLGDNSTISCCEVLNNLIYPAHEQHHNNSFLIASLIMGQSNMAAGVTVGSNHNSRANDGEVRAGRGFWPGLCTTIKHSSRFASFTLMAKGDYPAELDIPLPFSLIANSPTCDRLLMMPGFWWLYNMYALARNTWKFQSRDKRKNKLQNIEFDFLAPDTVEEILRARRLLETWVGKAAGKRAGKAGGAGSADVLAKTGRSLLEKNAASIDKLTVFAEDIECSDRPVQVLKARQGYAAYGEMLHYYAVKNLLAYLEADPRADLARMNRVLAGPRQSCWVNLGGQLIAEPELKTLMIDIKSGTLGKWDAIHDRYHRLWIDYATAKQKHAWAILCELLSVKELTLGVWKSALDKAVEIQRMISDRVYTGRKKDFDNPFRQNTFRNREEQKAVIGEPENNSFVKQVTKETAEFEKRAAAGKRI
jgi:hypothetical protein